MMATRIEGFFGAVTGPMDAQWMLDTIHEEAQASEERWGTYRSPHEAYGVLMEEIAELLEAIRANNDVAARYEAMQVAAVAYRFARDGYKR